MTAFPEEIDDPDDPNNAGGFLYQEIAFDLTRQSGEQDEFNRHYNFRGQQSSGDIPDTWGTPGWFSYAAGRMDAYYYNTSVEDSYWNAHPSNADEGIQNQLLYFDTKDYGGTEKQTIADLYLRWDGMPTTYRGYKYDPDKGFLIKTETQTKGIFYFQMPADQEGLTENTVFTLTYEITAGTHAGTRTFLFTFVPRSGRNAIKMDNLWEDAGEVWTTYRADTPDATTRSVYFNNAVTAFGKVQVVFGKKLENGAYDWVTGQEAGDSEWFRDKIIDQKIVLEDWGRGWLEMKPQKGSIGEHEIPDQVWGITDIPKEYTHVMFRCALDANAPLNNSTGAWPNETYWYWFSPPLEIDTTYTNPCFFAYRYLDADTAGSASDKAQLGDHSYLDGKWGSALEIYSLGDSSTKVPEGDFSTQDNTYYATATLYDYYSLWEQSGHSITEAPGGYDYNKQGVLLNIGISKYFEQFGNDTTGTSTRTPLYFGAGNMRNTDVSGDWS